MKTERFGGKHCFDFTFTSCDTITCLPVAGHMSGKHDINLLPPPPVPPPQESPIPQKKGKIQPICQLSVCTVVAAVQSA